jgi:hypothetical protein
MVALTSLAQAQAGDSLNQSQAKANSTSSPTPSLATTPTPSPTPFTATYSTQFPHAENPISENGNWINGGLHGINWTDVSTMPMQAMGTMPGTATGSARYADSTAVLSGTWGANQTATATIKVLSAASETGVFEEVELRLCTTIAPFSIRGYEFNCSVSTNSKNLYCQIGRWDGPRYNGSTGAVLLDSQPNGGNIVTGTVLKAVISGNDLYLYINGVLRCHAVDSTYRTGSPGVGFYVQGTTGVNANFGLSSFTATSP